jgi:hypothetical protein
MKKIFVLAVLMVLFMAPLVFAQEAPLNAISVNVGSPAYGALMEVINPHFDFYYPIIFTYQRLLSTHWSLVVSPSMTIKGDPVFGSRTTDEELWVGGEWHPFSQALAGACFGGAVFVANDSDLHGTFNYFAAGLGLSAEYQFVFQSGFVVNLGARVQYAIFTSGAPSGATLLSPFSFDPVIDIGFAF